MTDLKAALAPLGYHIANDNTHDCNCEDCTECDNPDWTWENLGEYPSHDTEDEAYASAFRHAHENREALMNAITKDLCFASAMPIQLFTNYAGIEGWSDPVGGDEPCDALWNLWVKHHGLEAHMEATK